MFSAGFDLCRRSDAMGNFQLLISILAALTAAEAGLFGEGRAQGFPVFSSSSSFERPGGLCLNGGRSVPSLTTGEHMFCLCADGFEGRRCEISERLDKPNSMHFLNTNPPTAAPSVAGAQCYEGVGLFYRGTESKSKSGRTCEEWDSSTRERYLASDINSGRHNYCRNLQYKRRPWCHVWKKQQLVWEYCRIPRCGFESTPARPTPEPEPEPEPTPAVEVTCGRRFRRKLMKIVGGTVAAVESHPWVAAIFWQSKSKERVFRCGGSLISPCWVLTAAHCFPEGSHSKHRRFSVVLGKNSMNESNPGVEQTFRVEEIIVHDGFNSSKDDFNNDIALLKLKAKRGKCAEESRWVRTVCLPPPQQNLQPGVTCEIAGYGKEKHGLWYKSQFLREAQVNLLADDVCRQDDYYANMISDNMFCAGRPDWSQDACEGDSGGPLACEVAGRHFLFGIISWGDGCAKEKRPGVYTRVSNYNRWIGEKTGLPSIAAGSVFPQK